MIQPNIAKGRFVAFAALLAANDGLVWVLFTGTESDANLKDAVSLAAIIALAVNEATFTGYVRLAATGIAITVDNTLDEARVDVADPSWSPTSAQTLTRIGLFYDPDTTGGTDADLIPIFIDDYVVTTPIVGSLPYVVNAAGFGKAV